MSKKLFVALTLCLSLLGSTSPILAQDEQKADQDVLTQLQRQGWKIVKDGVLQRELAPGEVESFVFGVPGFVWKIQDLQKQLRKLRVEFRVNPTPELRKAIANHRKAIANSQRALALAQAAEESGKEIDLSKVSCAINFSYDATATKNPSVAGVLANASATFNANCGFTGQVYAYAFAKTWVNGAETTDTRTDGPRSGANVSATASTSLNGGSPCESYAYGEMVSSGLNPSSWSKSATNTQCNPPLNVTVTSNAPSTTIDLYNSDCVTVTWTTNISGGTSPYTSTMFLNSASQGTRTTYSGTYCNAGTNTSVTAAVSSTVTDSSSPVQSTTASAPTITIRSHVAGPTATINGPAFLSVTACTTYTWTASVSGGTSPYTYQWTWDGAAVGTGSSYSRQYCPGLGGYTLNTYTLGLTVTDSASRSGNASKTVTVEKFGREIEECGSNGQVCP
ncbi:MAG TPA: hypothetical protein VF789_04095 [Thermoanaerobaculia bacterium]